MKVSRLALLAILAPSIASAHITIGSGPALANKSGQKISFAINHGCTAAGGAKLDTLSIKVDIPTGIDATTVRALPSDFGGTPAVAKTGTAVTSVTWSRNPAELQNDDVAYYELTLRLKVNDVPFTKIPWVITQVCRPQGGTPADDVTVVWTGPSTNAEPSPNLIVVPAHALGWHKITMTTAITTATDMGLFFGDAQIVWKGTSAFSANSFTTALIAMTTGVTPLATLAAGDEIWVKY